MAHSSPSMQPSVHSSPHAVEDQPGIEVVPENHLPEVRPDEEPKFCVPKSQHPEQKIHLGEDFPQVVADNGQIEVVSPTSTEKGTLPVKKPYWKRKWWIIGGTACVVAVIVIAVTVGVVLSLKSRRNGSETNPEGGNGTMTTERPETIRSGSSLSAVGWRKPNGDVERYLFYQDPQGQVRRSRSITYKANSMSTWEALPAVDLQVTNGTKLAASILVHGSEYNPQTEIYYEENKRILSASFNEARQPNIQIDNVSGGFSKGLSDLTMGNGADLTAYWPYIITQHQSGHVFVARGDSQSDLAPTGTWRVHNLTYPAYEGSALCIVPTSSNFTKISAPGGYGVIYQKPNQGMAFEVPDNTTMDSAHAASLPGSRSFPGQYVFPPATPMAAFAVAQSSNNDGHLVNVYVVIKGYGSGFGVWFAENSSNWMEEGPAALKNADEDSDIACSTLAPSPGNSEGTEVLLEPANGEVRCYFQREGRVVEVSFAGSTWTELGVVPIP